MEKWNQYQEVLRLGKKISKEFSSDNRNITIKWMDNYIANLIHLAENETDIQKKKELENECYETILKLWNQRNVSSSRLQPLGNYKDVISVLSSLKDEEESFHWNRYRTMNVQSPWNKLVNELKGNYKDSIEIAICASINVQYLNEGKEWLEYEKMLTKDEKSIIKHLDDLLTKSDSPFNFIIYEGGNENKNVEAISKKMQVLNRLTEMVEKQNTALNNLKSMIESNDSNSSD